MHYIELKALLIYSIDLEMLSKGVFKSKRMLLREIFWDFYEKILKVKERIHASEDKRKEFH